MSDTSQGPAWWQAVDGKWYPPNPAPGWWMASDGKWYPPVTPDSPTAESPSPAPAAPIPGLAVVGSPTAKAKSSKVPLAIGAIFVVIILLVAGIFIAKRSSDSSGTATGGGGPTSDQPVAGAPRPDGQPAVPALGKDELPTGDVKLTADTIVVRGNGGKTVISAASDGKTMVLDKNVEGVDKLAPGKVLLLTGMTVVKVKSVGKSGDNPEITIEPATLPDVIEDGNLTWTDQQVDPAKAQLFITGDKGWAAGPNGDGGAGSGGGGAGTDGGGGTKGGNGSDTDSTDSTIIDPSGLDLGAPILGEGESAAGAVRAIAGKTISGQAGGFGFDITYEGEGTGHHLDLKLKPTGDVAGTIEADIHIKSLANSGNIEMKGRKLQNFDFTLGDLGGTAVVTTDLSGISNVASWKTPAFFKLPFSLDFPAFVGGIPFTLSLSGTIEVHLVFSLANSTLSGRAEITYDGEAGFHVKATKLSLDGKRSQDSPDLLKTIKGVAPGPVGVVFTTELPKIGFGFKFLQTGAGIFISNGMVISQNILPPPVICTAANVAYVLAGGVEASFLGKDFEIARKAFVDKRWDWAAPNDKRCKGAKPGG